ncbi:MAG: hypothetical protein DMG08_30245 [Acidobacteria bacterium]|nr:MAG: hypothetical protein DMG08_30245 [Acidobacteriota bacterium]
MGASLLRIAQTRDTRVLLVGDIRQHVSVEAGDFLRILEQHSRLGKSELKDIRRQQVEEYNAAIRTMARGDALGGIEQLNALGWVQEGRGCYVAQAAEADFEATAGRRENSSGMGLPSPSMSRWTGPSSRRVTPQTTAGVWWSPSTHGLVPFSAAKRSRLSALRPAGCGCTVTTVRSMPPDTQRRSRSRCHEPSRSARATRFSSAVTIVKRVS